MLRTYILLMLFFAILLVRDEIYVQAVQLIECGYSGVSIPFFASLINKKLK